MLNVSEDAHRMFGHGRDAKEREKENQIIAANVARSRDAGAEEGSGGPVLLSLPRECGYSWAPRNDK